MKKMNCSVIVFATVVLGMIGCHTNDQGPTAGTTNVEDSIRKALGIPAAAKRVVILSHNSHMDWDWLNAFPYNSNQSGPEYDPNYFNGTTQPADSILSLASKNLSSYPSYYYSVCEMGFLRAFANNKPALFDAMRNSKRLSIVGGGMTSPDNLLPNGEAFFRNFLVGKQWLDGVKVPWSQQVWLPDDFGHDPQLPVMLQALDGIGVGFARIPGDCLWSGPQAFQAPQQMLLDTITGNGGVDFIWSAADSSVAIAHWLQAHYGQGINIDNPSQEFNSVADNLVCNQSVYPKTPVEHIQSYINTNGRVAPTPYIYVDVSGDFMIPYQQLVKDVNEWNNSTTGGYKTTGVYAVVATFDHYIRLVNTYQSKLKMRSYNPLGGDANYAAFQPNPYWMGYYASRPELKIMHNQATRTLLGAEMFQVISNTLLPVTPSQKQSQINALLAAWDSLAPSTHHDFITGTAVDDVYNNEQINLLKKSLSLGQGLNNQFISGIAASLPASPNSVAVFNQLGFNNQGVVAYQPTSGGATMYLNVTAPGCGYQVNDLKKAQQGNGTLKAGKDQVGNYLIRNDLISATFSTDSANLLYVGDIKANKNILAGTGNEIVVFNDGGGIYRFGYEDPSDYFTRARVSWSIKKITLDTANVLQKSISVEKMLTINGAGRAIPFTITYSLRQGEPFLRISTTGSLPYNYTAMVRFPLLANIDNIVAGTPYHWNAMKPATYGTNRDFNATMWATHDFVIPYSSGNMLAAVYHGATPAWTSVGNSLYGVILRNTPRDAYGAAGSDPGTHTQEYALRIPTGLQVVTTGQPFTEARYFNTPMIAVAAPATGSGKLPTSYSLATTTGSAYITAAKWSYTNPSALIMRFYQPSNIRISSKLTVSPKVAGCVAVSALEVPIQNANVKPSASPTGSSQYQLNLPRAVATFKLE